MSRWQKKGQERVQNTGARCLATTPKEEVLVGRLRKRLAIGNGVEKESSGKMPWILWIFCEIHSISKWQATAFWSVDLRWRESAFRAWYHAKNALRAWWIASHSANARNDGVGANSRIFICNDEWVGKFATPWLRQCSQWQALAVLRRLQKRCEFFFG